MTKINGTSVFDTIMKYSSKALGAVSKSKPIKWVGDQYQKNPEKALATTALASIVIKDGVGCYKYVTQSLNNKEIPEKKRNFVAALDLSNGVLMILAQMGMFLAMRKFSEPIFNKIFKKSFGSQAKENIAAKLHTLQIKNNEARTRGLVFDKDFAKVRKEALDLFKFVLDIGAATIVGKRIIVPFIATPLANVIKDKMDGKSVEKDDKKEMDIDEIEDKIEDLEEKKEALEAKKVDKDDERDDD